MNIDKKKMQYIILIAVAAVILVGLLIAAICLHGAKPNTNNESTGGQTQTTGDVLDTTAEDSTGSTEGNEENTRPTQGSTDSSGSSEGTTPTQGGTENTEAESYPYNVTYAEYRAMSGSEQMELFYEGFGGNVTEFNAWLAKAKQEHKKIELEIEDGKVDLGDIIKEP